MPETLTVGSRLTIDEVADLCGVAVKTIRDQRLRRVGVGALGYRVGNRVLFDADEVEEHLRRAKEDDRRDRDVLEGER